MKALRFIVGYFVTVIMSFIPITAFSWEYIEIDDIGYNLDETTLTASIDTPMEYFGMGGEGDVVIPECVSYEGQTYIVNCIGRYAFSSNEDMTSITLPNTIETIEACAFYGCTSLTRIIIPKSVSLIEELVFADCDVLSSIIVDAENDVYDSRNNCNAIIETKTNTLIHGCKNTIIPNSVTRIGEDAFWGCGTLTDITIPNSVTTIGAGAFYNCYELTSITLPNSLTSIDYIFGDCNELKDVYCYAENVPNSYSLGNDNNISEATLHVPPQSISQYQSTSPWSEFKYIVAIEDYVYDNLQEQTIDLNEIPAQTYGATYALPTTTMQERLLTWTVGDPSIASIIDGTLTALKAGTTTVTATQEGNAIYKPFTREFTLTVNKASLTIIADDKTKNVGDENPELTITYIGFVNGDDATALITLPSVCTSATNTSLAGDYPITISGAESGNYDITYVNGTLTVTERAVIPGDVNDDGVVDLSDAIMVTYYSLRVPQSNFIEDAGDLNGDGEIDLSDAIIIIYMSLDKQ